MTFTCIALETRHPSVTPEQFQHYCENNIVPVIKAYAGEFFPRKHTRYYTMRTNQTPDALKENSADYNDHTPLLFVGSPSDFDADLVVILEFENETHFLRFRERYFSPEAQTLLAESSKFVSKIAVIGMNGPNITTNDSSSGVERGSFLED